MDNEADDQTLLARYAAGDREAFATLVVRYQRPLYNAAFWVVRNADDAADVTQNVFLRVAERHDEYDPSYKFFSWIYRIAVNESLNVLRRHSREDVLDEENEVAAGESANPEVRLAEGQEAQRVRAALLRMSTNDRMVLTLRHFSECSYEEIAQILEIDEKTVKSRLHDARLRLRRMLSDLRPH
ncbi:MAG: sigma-70 family RNA polymerase sigma factor [Burkholderiales bacterium]